MKTSGCVNQYQNVPFWLTKRKTILRFLNKMTVVTIKQIQCESASNQVKEIEYTLFSHSI